MKMKISSFFYRVFTSNGAPVEWNWQGKTEALGEKPVPVPLCPPQTPHGTDPGSNPGLRSGRPATNRLSHGTAYLQALRALVLRKIGSPINIINDGRTLLMCELSWVGGVSLRGFFVFGQKSYTMELDIFECIQKGRGGGERKDAFEERSSPLDRRSDCSLSCLMWASQSNPMNILTIILFAGVNDNLHCAVAGAAARDREVGGLHRGKAVPYRPSQALRDPGGRGSQVF
jgi:hypothetical protein